ncbi:hypothetical protein [Prosthecobacter sp.]|uniref:hypothetical protein n=1 Tax=Prosthecobacter sp. TaxID=1965333 RepID=UPI003784F61B
MANEIRDTPGRLLLGWALLFTSLVILSWRIHLHRADYDWTEYPTALGDSQYYTTFGKDDRYEPNLRFPGQEEGLFLRGEKAVTFDDATMLKRARDSTGRHFIYQPAPPAPGKTGDKTPLPLPVYLKIGENLYVEFGARKFYPPFVPKTGP